MSTYRIEIDRSLCSGFGTCVDTSPRHFALDDTGIASVLVTHVELDGDPSSFRARYLGQAGETLNVLLANRPGEVAAAPRELARAA